MFSAANTVEEYKTIVYVPLYIAPQTKPLSDYAMYHSCAVNAVDVQVNRKINYELLASRIRVAAACGPVAVGKSISDLPRIVSQHNQFMRSYYAVEVKINETQLNREKDFTIKTNAYISSDDLQSIQLITPDPERNIANYFTVKDTNEAISLALPYDLNNATLLIKNCLNDAAFWKQHAHGVSFAVSFLGFQAIHSGVRKMRELINNCDDIPLEKLRKIASFYCPYDKTHQFFRQQPNWIEPLDDVTKSFFMTVCEASTIYDVVQWMEENYCKEQLLASETPQP